MEKRRAIGWVAVLLVLAGLPTFLGGTRRDLPPKKVPNAEVAARLKTTELAVFGLT